MPYALTAVMHDPWVMHPEKKACRRQTCDKVAKKRYEAQVRAKAVCIYTNVDGKAALTFSQQKNDVTMNQTKPKANNVPNKETAAAALSNTDKFDKRNYLKRHRAVDESMGRRSSSTH